MKINHRWVSTYLVTLCWLVPLACLTPSLFQAYGRVISIMLILTISFFLEMCLFSGWAEGLHPDLHNCSSRRRRFIISSLSLVFKQRLFYFIFIVNQGVVNDPKRLLFWAFAFPALLVIVASNIVIYMKIRGVSTNERVPTNQMKMNNFFLMLFLAFLAWLFTILPFVIVDTVIDPCFQVVLVVVLVLVVGPSNSSCCRLVPCQQKLPCISVLLCTIRFYTVGSERFQQMHLCTYVELEWMIDEHMFQKPGLHTITYILNWTKVETPINCSPTPIPLLLYQHSTLSISSPPDKLYASILIFFNCHISVTFVTHVIYLHHQKSDFYNY